VQAVTGQRTLLAGSPVLRRLRALPEDSPDREAVRTVAALSINGVAAGLQNTG
jgi:phosphoenolpyruvate carboxylase